MNDAIQQIGERLRGLRDVLDIPAEDVANLCGLDIDTYMKMEEGGKRRGGAAAGLSRRHADGLLRHVSGRQRGLR